MNEQTMIRLETELAELSDKAGKLDCFIGSQVFYGLDEDAQWDLKHQLQVMREYKSILQIRVAKAKGWMAPPSYSTGTVSCKGGN